MEITEKLLDEIVISNNGAVIILQVESVAEDDGSITNHHIGMIKGREFGIRLLIERLFKQEKIARIAEEVLQEKINAQLLETLKNINKSTLDSN